MTFCESRDFLFIRHFEGDAEAAGIDNEAIDTKRRGMLAGPVSAGRQQVYRGPEI